MAQRLGLPLHPNLRSALDSIMHGGGGAESSAHRVGNLDVIGGVADQGSAAPVSRAAVEALLNDLGQTSEVIVADLGPLDHAIRGFVSRMSSLLLVGKGDPVGVARLLVAAERLLNLVEPQSALLVVNMSDRNRYRRSEIRREIERALPRLPLVLIPFDRAVAGAVWEGETVPRGPFRRAVRQIAGLVGERALG